MWLDQMSRAYWVLRTLALAACLPASAALAQRPPHGFLLKMPEAHSMYPIRKGTPVDAKLREQWAPRLEAALRELASPADAPPELKKALPRLTGSVSRGRLDHLDCRVARRELARMQHFDPKKEEFLYPWKKLYSAPLGSRPPRCYRSYWEPPTGDGYAIYFTETGGRLQVLEIRSVPEVI
jgi:hypothetical protein